MLNLKKSSDLLKKISDITWIKMSELINICNKLDHYPRDYHNSDHILDLCAKIIAGNHDKTDTLLLLLVALFHDYIYDSKSKTNEEDSAEFFLKYSEDLTYLYYWQKLAIFNIIIDTKTHEPRSELAEVFCKYDLSSFDQSFADVLKGEFRIRKEYAWVDWDLYRKGKLEFLNNYITKPIFRGNVVATLNIRLLIDYVQNEKAPNIGIYTW